MTKVRMSLNVELKTTTSQVRSLWKRSRLVPIVCFDLESIKMRFQFLILVFILFSDYLCPAENGFSASS